MGIYKKTAANPLRMHDLVKVWQEKSRQMRAATPLLPHQERNLFTRFSRLHQNLTAQPRQLRRRLTHKARRTLTDIAFMLTLGIALPAEAATLLVNTNIPDVNVDGLCSLIEAIDNANADSVVHIDCPAGSGADVIQLQNGSVHNITAALSGLPAQGLPTISTLMSIDGNGATLHVAAVPVDRVIDVAATGDLTLSDATISGDAGSGTASNSPRIHNAGTLQLNNVSIPMELNRVAGITNLGTLTANQLLVENPGFYGGGFLQQNGNGILNEGNMTLTDSEVRDLLTRYTTEDFGSVINRGNMRLEQSSITGNYSYDSYAIAGIDNGGVINGSGLNVSDNRSSFQEWSGITNRAGATLNLEDSRIEHNVAYKGYGGLLNLGRANLERVTIVRNGTGLSNGLHNNLTGYLKLVDAFVSDTVYNWGEMVLTGVTKSGWNGLFNGGGITITNSTISNNRSGGYGYGPWPPFSGVKNEGRMTITSSTIAGNSAYSADYANFGLLNTTGATLSMSQTVVTGQFFSDGITTTTGRVLTNEGTILNSDYNLFGDNSLTSAEAFSGFTPGPTDVVATSDGTQPTPLNDILELRTVTFRDDSTPWVDVRTETDLKDNGGPTPTVALVPGSPAIDAAGMNCVPTDQRGVSRPQGAACDIGAYEAEPSAAGPLVQCPGDVNGDGIADIAVVTPDGNTRIKGLTGGLVSQFTLSDINAVVDVEMMVDINANGSPELVALGTGSVQAEVWDTLTVTQLSIVDFDPGFTPLDLELVDDQTGNGIPDLADLGQGSVQVEVKDALTAGLINTVSFSNYFNAKDLEIYPDLNGNGSPELAVLGDNKDPSKGDKVEVRDLATGNAIQNIWLGRGWQVLQQELIADHNGNGYEEVAVLRVKNNDDAVNVLFRDTKTRQGLGSIYFDRNYPPTQLLTIGDVNGNGADEVVVFGQRFNGGNQKAQVKDSKTQALIRAVFFDKNFAGQDMATCADINGNGAGELVLLGQRASDGKLKAIVKDAKTGERIGVVNF